MWRVYVTLPRVGSVLFYSVQVRMQDIIRVSYDIYVPLLGGHAINKAASCRLFTVETRVHSKGSSLSCRTVAPRQYFCPHVLQVIAVVIIPPMLHFHLFMSGDPLYVAAPQINRAIRIKKNHVLAKANILSFPYPPEEINSTCIKCNLYITAKTTIFIIFNNAYYMFRSIPPSSGMHVYN